MPEVGLSQRRSEGDKMQSEWPYRAEHWEGQNEFVVVGPGWENMGGTYTKNEAGIAARFANLAHAEGRKSMEKEIKDLRFAIGESDKDFKELLELANKLREYPWDEFEAFDSWKKARGLK